MHYFDNAATTAVYQEVIQTITETMGSCFGNPSALYRLGAESERVITQSRKIMAKTLGCTAGEVYFTSCGSESNNIAIWGAAVARKAWANRIVCSGYEHPSVEKVIRQTALLGYETAMVKPNRAGEVSLEELVEQVNSKTALVAVMQVNNETGAVVDVVKLAQAVKAKNPRTAVHVDGVQGFCKLPVSLGNSGIDSYSASGHKLHAPKGIGLLYLRKGYHIEPVYLGGGQENGMRPGTENIPYIAGFAKAVEMLAPHLRERLEQARARNAWLRHELTSIEGIRINSPQSAMPYTLNITLPGVRSETMLHYLEQKDIYVSSGSACSKGSPSKTLLAMGMSADEIDSSLRISFCGDTTQEDFDVLLESLRSGLQELQRKRRM